MLDENARVFLDRFLHLVPYSLSEPAHHRIVVIEIFQSPLIMVSHDENGWPERV